MRELPDEARGLIIAKFLRGISTSEICRALECSRHQVNRAVAAYCSEGRIVAKQKGGRKRRLTQTDVDFILDLIDDDCSITLRQIKKRLKGMDCGL